MNYYQYKRRVPETKKSFKDYIKPFILVLVVVAIVLAAWKLLSSIFGDDEDSQTVDKVSATVEVEVGDAEVMIANGTKWEKIPGRTKIYESEKVQTLSDGRLSMSFFEGTEARLDESSILAVRTLNKEPEPQIEVFLEKGNFWIDATNASGTEFNVSTEMLMANGGPGDRFALSESGTLYVLEGTMTVDILDEGEVIETVNVKGGEQVTVTASIVSDLSKGLERELLFDLDDEFKTSNWYRWNQQKDGVSVNEDESSEEEGQDEQEDEEDTEDEEDEEESDGEKPATPQITAPGKNGAEVILTKVDQFISGTVSEDTKKVVVNEYTLEQYVPGSGEFIYKASASTIKNLKVGKNTFTVTAYDEDGDKSDVATITLVLPQDVYDAAGLEEDDNEEDEEAASTGGVSITSPNGGQNFTTGETSFVISGTVPPKTNYVMVNGYQLQAFSSGSTTFSYNANTAVNTLKAGQKNTYNVVAYDENERVIGSASMTIDVTGGGNVSGSSSADEAPSAAGGLSASINMPTTAAVYETNLNQITLGGSVSGSPEAIYVNGNKVSYSPGSGSWSMSVTLTPGENSFNVYAEKEGQTSSSDSIVVNYKN